MTMQDIDGDFSLLVGWLKQKKKNTKKNIANNLRW